MLPTLWLVLSSAVLTLAFIFFPHSVLWAFFLVLASISLGIIGVISALVRGVR